MVILDTHMCVAVPSKKSSCRRVQGSHGIAPTMSEWSEVSLWMSRCFWVTSCIVDHSGLLCHFSLNHYHGHDFVEMLRSGSYGFLLPAQDGTAAQLSSRAVVDRTLARPNRFSPVKWTANWLKSGWPSKNNTQTHWGYVDIVISKCRHSMIYT